MNKPHKICTLIAIASIVLASCIDKPKAEKTPWGTNVADVETGGVSYSLSEDNVSGITSMEQIIDNGEMIVLTISGPDTYYDYHGRGLGVQYMMCESFARKIGVTLRVELCRDTLELVQKLKKGYGDIIAVQLPKWRYGGERKLRFCGAYVSSKGGKGKKTQWAVASGNPSLAKALDEWFRPDFPKLTLAYEDRLLAMAVTHSVNWKPSGAAFKANRSAYNAFFQRYAPLAGLPWQLIAAQCAQESGFDAGARSWAGACGLMQLMPSTAARLGVPRDELFDPEKNIAAACKLMGLLMRDFADVPSPQERICFALAAYNAGSGHVRDAMALTKKYGGDAHSWSSVEQYILHLCEPQYYQDPVVRYGFMRGRETYGYVRAIMMR